MSEGACATRDGARGVSARLNPGEAVARRPVRAIQPLNSSESDVEARVRHSTPQRTVSQFLSHSSSSAGVR